MIAESPTKLQKHFIDTQLDKLFETHRAKAFEQVMEKTLEEKFEAQLVMVKAYITYCTS